MRLSEPSALTEWVVLALLAEGPNHGFALARELEPESDLGRILTVHRPLVYRAIDRLVAGGMATRAAAEKGSGGPRRRPVTIAPAGEEAVKRWLRQPVSHVRDLRIEFLVKLRLLERSGVDSTDMLARQREELADRLQALTTAHDGEDVVERWRRHNALAVSAFLETSSPG